MKIMIVEDNALLQQNLQFLFDGEANMRVTTVADSAEEALALFAASEVEVGICDLGLPGMGGVELIAEMQKDAIAEQYLLSPREVEVLKQIEAGMSYADAGEALGISMHTVNAHIKKIYSKLQAKNRAEALTKARQKGII